MIEPQLKKWRKYSAVVTSVFLVGLIVVGYGHLQENRKPTMDQRNRKVAQNHTDRGNRNSAQNEKADSELKKNGVNTNEISHNAKKRLKMLKKK